MLLAAFQQQCRLHPDKEALHEHGRSLTYGQLLKQAQTVASLLKQASVQAGQTVAIYLDRGINATISVFGVLLAGACYVPLDLKNPQHRLQFIVADARVAAVLGIGKPPVWLDSSLWLDINTGSDNGYVATELKADALAALLYTSGSTGQPRGVALSHGAIAAFAVWAADIVKLKASDRIAVSSPLFFDLSTFDLYAVTATGASLHFVPSSLTMSPSRLSLWLKDNAITGWYTVPSLLGFLAWKGNLAQTLLVDLRFLIFAGEVFPSPALIDLAGKLAKTALYNFFGPTETNVCCYWKVDRQRLDASKAIPIGLPAADVELEINNKAEDGSGELMVRGATLASGYFEQGHTQPLLNEHGWYATGDRVSLVDGQYHFHGRLGRMLKCSGYRVEPLEIETAVFAMKGVTDCAVIGIADAATGQQPALAVCLTATTSIGAIRTALKQQLPSYMQPGHCIELVELPRLPNGKLDYRKLHDLLETRL
jgi:amino acid adenylation domain-containing protein